MATAFPITYLPRRVHRAARMAARTGRKPRFTPAERQAIATLREAILDRVEQLLDLADALDGDPDLEPDADGEAEPDEASLHPATLAADRVPAVLVRPPARMQGGR